MKNKEQENNIPALRTCGYHGEPCTTNIIGATHLEFSIRFVALNPLAAAPQNICRTGNNPLWMKVQRTVTVLPDSNLQGLKRYETKRPVPGVQTLTIPEGMDASRLHIRDGTTNVVFSIPEGLHVYRTAVNRENTTPAGVEQSAAPCYLYTHLMPLASCDGINK